MQEAPIDVEQELRSEEEMLPAPTEGVEAELLPVSATEQLEEFRYTSTPNEFLFWTMLHQEKEKSRQLEEQIDHLARDSPAVPSLLVSPIPEGSFETRGKKRRVDSILQQNKPAPFQKALGQDLLSSFLAKLHEAKQEEAALESILEDTLPLSPSIMRH